MRALLALNVALASALLTLAALTSCTEHGSQPDAAPADAPLSIICGPIPLAPSLAHETAPDGTVSLTADAFRLVQMYVELSTRWMHCTAEGV